MCRLKLILVILISVVITFRMVAGLQCFTCIEAASNEECNEKGEIIECASNELSCQNEVRISEGNSYRISKRCKQPLACHNNQAQNTRPAWDPTQCNLLFTSNSVCRCCCNEDLCNQVALPCDEDPRCPVAKAPKNGKVSCSNLNFYNSTCVFECNQGYDLVGPVKITCLDLPIAPDWDNEAPICKRAVCGNGPLAAPSNGRVLCSDTNKIESECSFICNTGYKLTGASRTRCNINGQWSEELPQCSRVTCNEEYTEKIGFGETLCSDSNFYNSECTFICYEGFYLDAGSSSATCQNNGQWSDTKGTCKQITCEENAVKLENGVTTCSNKNIYNSTCTFTCNEGYSLLGMRYTTCQNDFNWSLTTPRCRKRKCEQTEEEITPNDGRVVCTDENYAFSKCDFICDDGSGKWETIGSNTTTCALDPNADIYRWSHAPPCCAKRCPPFAQVDLFLVLDSSSSVGKENWNKTVYFIKDVIDNFIISAEDMLVAAIRYNRVVDANSEIKIGQFTTHKSTTDAIINLPYDGSGTFTGNAITYVLDNMLTSAGNRPNVPDIVLVVTDGISKDDVITPAKKLRRAVSNIIAIGVVNRIGALKEEDIVDIAQNEENAILVKNGFDGLSLSDERINDVLAYICGQPCGDSAE